MRTFIKSIMLVAIVAIGFTSCSTDGEPEVDVRDQAVGTYSGTMSPYFLGKDGVLYEDEEFLGKPETVSGIQVSKDETSEGSIEINIGDGIYYGRKIEESSNGFTFDIESQTVDGKTLIGHNTIELGSTEYHGGFFSDTKELTIGYSSDWEQWFTDEQRENIEAAGLDYESVVMIFDLNKR